MLLPLIFCLLVCSGIARAEDVVASSNPKPDPDAMSVGEIIVMVVVMIAPIAFFVWLFFYDERTTAVSTPAKEVRIVGDVRRRNR